MALGVSKVKIYFALGERDFTLDYTKVPANAWRLIKQVTGLTQQSVLSGISTGDIDAAYALVYLERSQRDRKLNYQSVENELDKTTEDFTFHGALVNGALIGEVPESLKDAEEDPTNGS